MQQLSVNQSAEVTRHAGGERAVANDKADFNVPVLYDLRAIPYQLRIGDAIDEDRGHVPSSLRASALIGINALA
jgi:hypothetical protein